MPRHWRTASKEAIKGDVPDLSSEASTSSYASSSLTIPADKTSDKAPMDDTTPYDAPPDYDSLDAPPTSPSKDAKKPDKKERAASESFLPAGLSSAGASTSASASISSLPASRPALYPFASEQGIGGGSTKSKKGKGKGKSWFSLRSSASKSAQSRSAAELRTTVLGLVRELLQAPYAHARVAVLQSCKDVCDEAEVPFFALLQEASIEGHTPLYWAILHRPRSRPSGACFPSQLVAEPDWDTAQELAAVLLRCAAPLAPAAVADARLACLVASDNPLYQRLRGSRYFSALSGTDRMLVGPGHAAVDVVAVENVADEHSSFVARIEVPKFHVRMRVSGSVVCEFIARGRLFRLAFAVAPCDALQVPRKHKSGTWLAALSLAEHSPPCFLDAQLIVRDQTSVTNITFSKGTTRVSKPKLRPPVELRLKTSGAAQLAPRELGKSGFEHDVFAKFEEGTYAASLQNEGSPYIQRDETLRATLEAKLSKPDGECVIC